MKKTKFTDSQIAFLIPPYNASHRQVLASPDKQIRLFW